jgi:uncharacterized protein YneF (UPF0154 family)
MLYALVGVVCLVAGVAGGIWWSKNRAKVAAEVAQKLG